MSRIGKKPVLLPAGVQVKINGSDVHVKGPKGELTRSFDPAMTIAQQGNEVIVSRPDDLRQRGSRSNAAASRSGWLRNSVW